MKACWIVLCVSLCSTFAYPSPSVRPAPRAQTLCVYDPSGAHGDAFNLAKDYRTAALAWGVALTLKPYTDERTAFEDFKASQCHAVLLTGVRARSLHPFAGTIEALGALPSYSQLASVLQHLASPRASPLMKHGPYETAAIFPAGAVYLFLRHRTVRSIDDLAGQRIATLDFDEAARTLVNEVGASMATADIGTFGPMFNNGAVDACYAPAVAYGPLELNKGLGSHGSIIRYPLAQLTFQILVRTEHMPALFGERSRTYMASYMAHVLRRIAWAEKSIPSTYWVDVPQAEKKSYEAMFQKVRLMLRDKKRVYDKTMLTLLRRVRCQTHPTHAECTQIRE